MDIFSLYSVFSGISINSSTFGEGNGTQMFDVQRCFGNEHSIAHCAHLGVGVTICNNDSDIGVKCYNDTYKGTVIS